MDSNPISQFLESTYPDLSVPLTSPLGDQISAKARAILGPAARTSLMPREIHILSPRTQEWFRRSREAELGHPLEDLLEKENEMWASVHDGLREVNDLMMTYRQEGPFVLGGKPSYADFFLAGALESARVVDEGTFARFMEWEGFKGMYEGCRVWMENRE